MSASLLLESDGGRGKGVAAGTAHSFLANLKLLNQKVFAHCDFNLQLAQAETKCVDITRPPAQLSCALSLVPFSNLAAISEG